MNSSQINCPNCGKSISVDEVLSHQIKESLGKDYEQKLKDQELQLKKTIDQEKLKLEEKLRLELKEQNELSLKSLEQQSKIKDEKLEEFQKQILDLLKQKAELEQLTKEAELKAARQLDQERTKIKEDAQKQLTEEYRLKELENEKRLSDALKANEDLRRKLEQGSQQLQGEVLELDIEELLRTSFPTDHISPVGKGVKGGDIVQIVKSPSGSTTCGQILWEIKRTKNWSEAWVGKLKQDRRQAKADLAVIISTSLPEIAISGLGQIDNNIWVCNQKFVIALASLLRKALLDVAYQKSIATHQGRKADLIYDYITGHNFRQQIESLVEIYQETQTQIAKERAAFERIWKAREGQAQRLILSAASIYGSMQGLAGNNAMPSLKGLSLELSQGGEEQDL